MLDCKTFVFFCVETRGLRAKGLRVSLKWTSETGERRKFFLALRALRACEARVRSVPRNKEQDLNLDQLLTERNSYDYTTIATCHNLTPAS